MEAIDVIINLVPVLKKICIGVLIIAIIVVLIRRAKIKLVTLDEIVEWGNHNKHLGCNLYVHKLSVIPNETRSKILREIGIKKILNGYTCEGSVLATIVNKNGEVVKSLPIMGNKLDEKLSLAIGAEIGLNIKL